MSGKRRQMHLGVFVLGTGNHSAGWRYDGAATSNNDLSVIQEIARHAALSFSREAHTPKHIADTLEEWVVEEAADGFNVLPPYFPGALIDFVDQVVRELQARGLFRREYEGTTLRDHFGLPSVPAPTR